MSFLQRKIDEYRQLPEEARLKKAHRITWISGVALLALWGAVLLPFQLYVQGGDDRASSVQGVQTTQEASQLGTGENPPATIVPSPTIELQR